MIRKLKLFFAFIDRHPAGIASWIIIAIVTWTNADLKFWKNPDRILVWDVKAYYAYLPATIIYHDLSLSFVEKHRDEIGQAMFLEKAPSGKYYIMTTYGLSLLYSPFFLATHGITWLTGGPANGYSPPYKLALIISCIFYLAVGIYFLRKFLLIYFSRWATAITLVAVVLGTNLFYYSTYEAPMSHAYNFALIAALIYFTDVWYKKINFRNSVIIGFLLGLIALIRPVNLLVLLFFVLWGVSTLESFRERILLLVRSFKWIIVMMIVFFIIWIPQFLYWKYISGSYLFYSYSDMGFFFNNPQVVNSLFSYRKGLFLYIPLMAIAYLGIPFLFRSLRGSVLPVALFAAINIYILSSWCFWWFGGSFGPRSYIDTYAILAIPFAAITNRALNYRWWSRFPFIALVGTLVWFNFFQTKQYYHGAIHWVANTKESYWDSFLRKYPSKEFWQKLRFPNREYAIKGIYFEGDQTLDEFYPKKTEEPDNVKIDLEQREKYIKNLDKYIRSKDKWFQQMKDKAAQKGISVDSAIRRDAIWLYETEKQKK
jgi:hypothetical protein